MRLRSVYREAIILGGLALALCVVVLVTGRAKPRDTGSDEVSLIQVDASSVRQIALHRGSQELRFVRTADQWQCRDCDWQPRQAILNRAAHQLHRLVARERIESPADAQRYGLGASRVQVELVEESGQVYRVNVGDLTPSGISYYVAMDGYPDVYVVKRAAVEFARAPLSDFQHDRPFQHHSGTVERVVARRADDVHQWVLKDSMWTYTENGREIGVLDDERGFRESVERLLDAKVQIVDSNDAADSSICPFGAITVTLTDGRTVDFCAVDMQSNGAPIIRWSESPDVYTIAARNWEWAWDDVVIGGSESRLFQSVSEAPWLRVDDGEREVTIARTVDGWRWDDSTPVAGATPALLIDSLTSLNPRRTASEYRDDGESLTLIIPVSDSQVAAYFFRTADQMQMQVGDETYVVAPAIWEHLVDLVKQYGRHEAEKRERQFGAD